MLSVITYKDTLNSLLSIVKTCLLRVLNGYTTKNILVKIHKQQVKPSNCHQKNLAIQVNLKVRINRLSKIKNYKNYFGNYRNLLPKRLRRDKERAERIEEANDRFERNRGTSFYVNIQKVISLLFEKY